MKHEKTIISVFAVAISFFHLYTAVFGMLEAQAQRAVHICTLMALVFLLMPLFGVAQEYGLLGFFYRRFQEALPGRWLPILASASVFTARAYMRGS